ncbi:hypothetical protein NKH77_39905 [Streptomyces sp. M19]
MIEEIDTGAAPEELRCTTTDDWWRSASTGHCASSSGRPSTRSGPADRLRVADPGEPVPVAEALRGTYEPFEKGTDWGSPWATWWFRIEGSVPAAWAGRRVEAVIDPGFAHDDQPGFQAEGLVYDAEGVPIKGIHPRNRHIPWSPRRGRRAGRAAPGGGGEPERAARRLRPHPARGRAHRR